MLAPEEARRSSDSIAIVADMPKLYSQAKPSEDADTEKS